MKKGVMIKGSDEMVGSNGYHQLNVNPPNLPVGQGWSSSISTKNT